MKIWQLSRPKSALPSSYFWTWDHSTNWMIDDPGMLTHGCDNRYLKRPETFVEDYRRLTDLAAGLGIKGILIWGFLRDSHGGIEYAKRVASYAAAKGVAIMPGIGTTWYGGVYYEGSHPYNLETFLAKTPEARAKMIDGSSGKAYEGGACPCSPAYLDWLRESVQWLFKEFEIGGANLENGDFLVCTDPRCKAHKETWPADDPDIFRLQAMSYEPALRAIEDLLPQRLVTWATYTGFTPGKKQVENGGPDWAYMQCDRPAMIDRLPQASIGQWTLTSMVRRDPLPLIAYLDNGSPAEAFDNPNWPQGVKPPSVRSCGFIHQGSQWSHVRRYELAVSTIKEACLRAYRSGMEGVVIHGEVTSRHIPAALNYLAFSHFTHWPEDSLRDFGRKTLGQVFENEDEGDVFAEALAKWDSAEVTEEIKTDVRQRVRSLWSDVEQGVQPDKWHFWNWLSHMLSNRTEPHTVSFL